MAETEETNEEIVVEDNQVICVDGPALLNDGRRS